MDAPLRIDATHGEGGGQLLRAALTLAVTLQRSVELYGIRASRRPAGLGAEHLAFVRAMAQLCDAELQGDVIGSEYVSFAPAHPPSASTYAFDVSVLAERPNAGSITLLLQALLLPLALHAGQACTLILTGGTHVPQTPSYPYLADVTLPLLERLGIRCTLELGDWGWQPEGGGRIEAHIEPLEAGSTLRSLTLTERGSLQHVWGLSAASNLPAHIIQRQRTRLEARLRSRHIRPELIGLNAPASGTGTIVFLLAEYESVSAGFTAYGRLRYPAERVADDAFEAFDVYRGSQAAVDPHLADQILLPLALAPGPSRFTVSQITPHTLTTAWVINQFVDRSIEVRGSAGASGEIVIQ
jgi:RNA 3'-terminal phosphate cyclase (ATP)